jgi:hypothetical protein
MNTTPERLAPSVLGDSSPDFPGWIYRMDRVREFLETLKKSDLAQGYFLGVLHVLIGRHISKSDGTLVSTGMTWREAAGWLKKVRWKKEALRELNLSPTTMPPRDRLRYWYLGIAGARVDSPEAFRAAARLAEKLLPLGYVIGPAPAGERTTG